MQPVAPAARAAPKAAAAPVAAEEEAVEKEDPMQEANFYLAYEQYDQAVDFVKKALEKEPDNLEFHIKLLEVYYTANRKKAYEQAAKVLHDKVGGQGDYWTMALAMWQELSPKRAMFAAPAPGEEEPEAAVAAGGGIVDISGVGAGAEAGEGILDVTAAGEGEADMLDVTAIAGIEDEALDKTAVAEFPEEEETAAVDAGLDFSITGEEEAPPVMDEKKAAAPDLEALDFTLDFPGAGDETAETAGEETDLLDVTSTPAFDEDLFKAGSESPLDISSTAGGDLLDVPSAREFETEVEEDLLDVTSAPAEGLDSGEIPPAREKAAVGDDHFIDFDVGEAAPEQESAIDELALDFELTPDAGAEAREAEEEPAEAEFGIDLDVGTGEAGGLELALEEEQPKATGKGAGSELSLVDDGGEGGLELDMPELELDITGEAEDESEHTVFVPRTSQDSAQSEDDEIATQLDLAKAYVELGDKDNAKTILDEIVVIGNEKQRQQAQELLDQIS